MSPTTTRKADAPKSVLDSTEIDLTGNEDEKDVLDLGDLTPTRRLVRIPTDDHPEGERYRVRQLSDFGVEDQQWLMALSRSYQKLMNRDSKLSPKERTRLRDSFDEMYNLVFDAPATIKRKLPERYKQAVVQAFTAGPLLTQQEAQMTVIRRLVDKGMVNEDDVNEVLREIRLEVAKDQMTLSTSTSGN